MLLPKGHRTVGNGNLSGSEEAKEFGEVREKDLKKLENMKTDKVINMFIQRGELASHV